MVSAPHTLAAFFSAVLELDLRHSKMKAVLLLPTQSAGSLEGFWARPGELQGHSLPRRGCQDTEVPHTPPPLGTNLGPLQAVVPGNTLFSLGPTCFQKVPADRPDHVAPSVGCLSSFVAMPGFPSWGGPPPDACLHAYAATHPSHLRVLDSSWGNTRYLCPRSSLVGT